MPSGDLELFANADEAAQTGASGTVGVIVSTTPAAGTSETWTLTTGHGARFPVVAAGQVLRAKCGDELLYITAHTSSSDSVTLTRGAESSSITTHPVGAFFTCVMTADGARRWVPEYVWQPRHHGWVGWNMDLALAQSPAATTTLVPTLMKMYVPERIVITNVVTITGGTAGATLVAGSNKVGVYNSAGTLLAQSADVTAWGASTLFTTALTAAQTVTGGPGVFVWIARLISATTMPTVARGASGLAAATVNGGLTAATARWGNLAAVTSGNSLPASFTPSTGITLSSAMNWGAVS